MLTILHDVHLGANRSAGTTALTKLQLKQHLQQQFKELLPTGSDLMILGDLFDTHDVAMSEVLTTYLTLIEWLDNNSQTLYLVPGNHDLSKTSTTLSSFEFLCKLLHMYDIAKVKVLDTAQMTPYGYVIPHVANQELFDAEMLKVPECDFLFLHVNYDNHFAAQSDQSLNLSAEQAEACLARSIVIAHEHNTRQVGKIIVPGNQTCSSISDWLHSTTKSKAVIDNGVCTLHVVRSASDEYAEMDWKHLVPSTAKFIRVTGEATAAEASQAISAVARYRSTSPALVITSAFRVESEDGTSFSDSLEQVQGFDIWAALEGYLTAEQFQKVKSVHA